LEPPYRHGADLKIKSATVVKRKKHAELSQCQEALEIINANLKKVAKLL